MGCPRRPPPASGHKWWPRRIVDKMSATDRAIETGEDLYRIERAMSVYAHPDDAEFGCSGTLARMAADGIEVTVVVCTAGNRGGEGDRTEEELAAVRQQEQEAANKILGIANYVNLVYHDSSLMPSLALLQDHTQENPHIQQGGRNSGTP